VVAYHRSRFILRPAMRLLLFALKIVEASIPLSVKAGLRLSPPAIRMSPLCGSSSWALQKISVAVPFGSVR
jgi:hypothetical protein